MLGSPILWHPLWSRVRTAKCNASATKRTVDTTRTTNNPKDKPFSKYAKGVLQTRASGGCQGKCAANASGRRGKQETQAVGGRGRGRGEKHKKVQINRVSFSYITQLVLPTCRERRCNHSEVNGHEVHNKEPGDCLCRVDSFFHIRAAGFTIKIYVQKSLPFTFIWQGRINSL